MTTTTAPDTAPPAAQAARAVLRAEARLFRREPGALFWIVAFPSLLVTVLGLIPGFREPDASLGGLRVIDLYVPVAVLLSIVVAGVQTLPAVLTGYRERGILRRLSVTPVDPKALIGAQLVLHGVAVLAAIVLALAVGRIAFGVPLPGQPFGYALAVVLTALAGTASGGTIAALSRTSKAAQTIGTVAFFPAMFSAGVYLPVQTMPDTLRQVVELTPFGAASQALHDTAGGGWPQWWQLLVIALWAGVLWAAAVRWFRWE
ncbi:ABC transporter permease [Streptomyces sp. DSM 42041]|uniref:Transport permease protein n=1 Tax=Streptomyces hazeniae TaxID=3075538 RepID=A0ABU2NU45_9ACTN|nr:ABC transporter permease [Streptomyces sp. DSM 42041]MDT0380245.1 ABC transporter permease [Streptomyces sp. DSM 42041]